MMLYTDTEILANKSTSFITFALLDDMQKFNFLLMPKPQSDIVARISLELRNETSEPVLVGN